MQIGIALNIPAVEGRSDTMVIREHMALGDFAEPLGFDSLFVLEHHFTGYLMSPTPFQILAYYAGRTSRIKLGTAVIVLPWHDPIKVAEAISMLDIICNGRCIFAFGRGAAESEFEGFRVPMSESRERFIEAAEVVVGSLANEIFQYEGKFYQIPRLTIRPRPFSRPQERFYGSSMGKESANMVAQLGFGMLISTQKPWTVLSSDVARFHEIAFNIDHNPTGPIVLAAVSVDQSRNHAHERALEYLSKDLAMIDAHYRFSEGQLATIKGYESYASTQEHFSQLKARSYCDPSYVEMQLVGTPDDCIQQIGELVRLTDLEHLVLEFSYGGMPHQEAESNMKLFASEVLPNLRRDRVDKVDSIAQESPEGHAQE